MLSLTGIIGIKTGPEQAICDALLAVAANAQLNARQMIGFFVSQDAANLCSFITCERFVDQSSMDRHNGSEAVARFHSIAAPYRDGDVMLLKAVEMSARTWRSCARVRASGATSRRRLDVAGTTSSRLGQTSDPGLDLEASERPVSTTSPNW